MKTKIKKLSSVLISLVLAVTMTVTSVLSANAAATNTGARVYSNFKTSPAYQNYSEFKNLYVGSRTSIIPGLNNTNVNGVDCTTMVPQGITAAKDYFFIAAYDSEKVCNSVIYVLSNTDQQNRKYLTTLVLRNKTHAGGMGFDGSYVWVANDTTTANNKVSCFSYATLDKKIKWAVKNKKSSVNVDYHATITVDVEASYLTCYDGTLFVGAFTKMGNDTAKMYAYSYSSDRKKLTKKYYIDMPTRTQGVCFKDGYMVISRSWSRSTTVSSYISELRVYKPSLNNPVNGVVKRNGVKKTITMPPMTEGLTLYGSFMYLAFESAAYKYYNSESTSSCKYPVDRVVAFKWADVIAY